MATSEMIQELIRAHVGGDSDRFRQVAMQVAAREARAGHRLVAGRIRDLIEQPLPQPTAQPTPIMRPERDLQGVLAVSYPEESLRDIVLEDSAAQSFTRVLTEHHLTGKLAEWGLAPRRRLLLYGPPGCGKTLSATVLAGELSLPLFRVRVETLFSRYMGETASLLTDIFAQAATKRGVYLFDEFDAIGKHRADETDVGEARRIVSTFLQLLDADESDSVLVAATNEEGSIDRALFRRFDDVVKFQLPGFDALRRVYRLRTGGHSFSDAEVDKFASQSKGLSYADATTAVVNAMKAVVIDDRDRLRTEDMLAAIGEIAARGPSFGP